MPRDVVLMLIGAFLLSAVQTIIRWSQRLPMIHKLAKQDSIGLYTGHNDKVYPYGYRGAYRQLKSKGWPSNDAYFGRKS